ncbi:Uncharacterised protein [Buttiauxella agrestis]|uniref:Oxalurate catabolism protein HpxX n=2 Tax=Buttiauxella agrestis TaxID=82977 RepID=A0A381CBI1_9ENTR|nr:Uncharacterised protein [Buttiauxella agrestis]
MTRAVMAAPQDSKDKQMKSESFDWPAYIQLMEQLLNVPLDDMRRKEIEIQLTRMAALAEPLMEFPLPQRQEVAGVYKL